MKRFIPVVLVIAIAAVVVAVNSGGTSKAQNPASNGASIGLRTTPLGRVLVDGGGRTLYLFEADKQNMSNCAGACLSLWPAVASHGAPTAGAGVNAAQLGTIAATRQVTYNGHPLYYYAADTKPGDTTGQGLDQFGAPWYVLAASGQKIDND